MRFRVLGPLEVVDADRVVGLGGTRQRAALGYLLLHLNQVVATSQLLGALWADEAPASARKILQNAIWGLRGVLSSPGGTGDSATLVTQAPGYMLCADPSLVDLYEFNRLAERGQALLAVQDFEEASRALSQALALWRGPALIDLVEAGLAWRELTALQNLRLDVLEDYFEAELSCGRHTVLAELERTVEANPLRERSCGQLMLALYRGGRQADALTVFSRVRTELVERLGLEPRRELQMLQHAILTHDRTLMSAPSALAEVLPMPAAASRAAPAREAAELVLSAAPSASAGRFSLPDPSTTLSVSASPAVPSGPHPPDRPVVAYSPAAAGGQIPAARLAAPDGLGVPEEPGARPGRAVPAGPVVVPVAAVAGAEGDEAAVPAPVQLKPVSMLMVHATVDARDEVDRFHLLDGVADSIRESVGYFNGIVAASIGPVTMALFDRSAEQDDSAERAVWAALAVRDCLGEAASVAGARVAVRAAVTTGPALVRHQVTEAGVLLNVNGVPVEECQAVLDEVPEGGTWISDAVREATARTVLCHEVAAAPRLWQVDGVRSELVRYDGAPVVDREHELELLRGLMDRIWHRRTPHLVTVLGDAGVGKTRFLLEFQRRVVGHPTTAQVVVAPARPDQDGVRAVLTESVAACCGITPRDPAAAVRAKLEATAQRHLAPDRAGVVADALLPLLVPPGRAAGEVTGAWRELIGAVARDLGLVLVVDDLHHADDRLLGFIDGLGTSFGTVPLLVVAAARSELAERRPDWSGGLRQATTIILDPLSDEAIDRLLEVLRTHGEPAPSDVWPVPPGDGADARRGHVRMMLCLDRRMLVEPAQARSA